MEKRCEDGRKAGERGRDDQDKEEGQWEREISEGEEEEAMWNG